MTTPRCPHCNAQGLKNLSRTLAGPIAVIHCAKCGAIFGVIPNSPEQPKAKTTGGPIKKQPPAPPPTPEKSASTGKLNKPSEFIAELGHTDLSQKQPYSPELMAARMRAAGIGHGTIYQKIAIDDGPPCCLQHKQEMREFVIPSQYPNKYRVVWVCLVQDCTEWELKQ